MRGSLTTENNDFGERTCPDARYSPLPAILTMRDLKELAEKRSHLTALIISAANF
jgi:hypothetical protein